jgi:three-Cys-motif partner protein
MLLYIKSCVVSVSSGWGTMGELILGDDGLPAQEVGVWAKEKHRLLRRYVDICRATRKKYIGKSKGGASYIDLFCGPGRAKIRDTGEWIEGSAVTAWNMSVQGGAPFTKVIIGDADEECLEAATARLRQVGAPVIALHGTAKETASRALKESEPYGLNFAFLDPFNLGALDFKTFRTLSQIRRIDILVHVSKMDLQRNAANYTREEEETAFDAFAPGWRDHVDTRQSLQNIRMGVFQFWRELIASTGVWPSDDVRLVCGSRNQPLYWLLLAAKHDLAHKFWKEISDDGQGKLDL